MSDTTLQPPFTTQTKKSFLVVEFTLPSLMSAQNLKEVQAQLFTVIDEENSSKVIFNLSRVRDISSQFLGILIAVHTRLSKRRGKLVVVGLNDKLNELMQLTRLDRVITIVPSVNDAIERDAFL